MEKYIVSRRQVIYMEDNKIIWFDKFKDLQDRKDTIKHLKDGGNTKIIFAY